MTDGGVCQETKSACKAAYKIVIFQIDKRNARMPVEQAGVFYCVQG
jgi:hypothetical protein